MARPRAYGERVRHTVRFPPELLDEIRGSAEEADVGVNLWIERACRRYLAWLGAANREEDPSPPWEWRERRR